MGFTFMSMEWMSFDRDNTPLMYGVNGYGEAVNDVVAVAIDPRSEPRLSGSWEEGLVEFRDRAPIGFYNNSNSSLLEETNNDRTK